jgi:hypothetical protein
MATTLFQVRPPPAPKPSVKHASAVAGVIRVDRLDGTAIAAIPAPLAACKESKQRLMTTLPYLAMSVACGYQALRSEA